MTLVEAVYQFVLQYVQYYLRFRDQSVNGFWIFSNIEDEQYFDLTVSLLRLIVDIVKRE